MKKLLSFALCFVMLLSVPVTAQAATVGRVKGVCVYKVEAKSVKLKWKKVKKATGYQVFCSTKRNSGYIKVKTIKKGTTLKAKIKNLQPNKKYYFKVRAVNGRKKGRFSKRIKVITKSDSPESELPDEYVSVINSYKNMGDGYAGAYYNTLDMLTPYGKQQVLVVTLFLSAYLQHSEVYMINDEGRAEHYLTLPGALNYVTANRRGILTYFYAGSGMGTYVFLKYDENEKTYKETEKYEFEMDTRDSVTDKVSKKAKDYLLFEYEKHEIQLR